MFISSKKAWWLSLTSPNTIFCLYYICPERRNEQSLKLLTNITGKPLLKTIYNGIGDCLNAIPNSVESLVFYP